MKVCSFAVGLVISSLFSSQALAHEHDPAEIEAEISESVITCTSSVRLQGFETKYFLNSMGANYGSGSAQQIVTSVGRADSYDSIFTVKESERDLQKGHKCYTGQPLECGDFVRFEHNQTGKNLHSHSAYKSPLSQRQEVSAYGFQGDGDNGDDWQIVCNTEAKYGWTGLPGDVIKGKSLFYLKHVDTNAYLESPTNLKFTQQNCPRCIIVDHLEVSAIGPKRTSGLWKVHSGFFFPEREAEEPAQQSFKYQQIQ